MDLDKKKKKRNNVKTLLKSVWIRVYRKKEKSRNNLISGDEGRNQNGIEKKKKGRTFVPVYRATGLMAAINESLIGVHDVTIRTVSISTRRP